MKYYEIHFWDMQNYGILSRTIIDAMSIELALEKWKSEFTQRPSPVTGEFSRIIKVYQVTSTPIELDPFMVEKLGIEVDKRDLKE